MRVRCKQPKFRMWFVESGAGKHLDLYVRRNMQTLSSPKCRLRLANGEALHLETGHTPSTAWNDVGGIYLFVRPNGSKWQILYVGKTDSFRDRGFGSAHHKWAAAVAKGATQIHAAVVGTEAERGRLEYLIYSELKPPLNDVAPTTPIALSALLLGATRPAAPSMLGLGLPSEYERYSVNLFAQPGMIGLGNLGRR